ncbi:MAG: nucleotide sugar dehydrogenase, partial [Nitrososphaeria archaeon]
MVRQRISIIGLGYVGLCTAVGFASKGYNSITVDNDPKKVELVKQGVPPFHEVCLERLMQKTLRAGRLKCTTDYKEAILQSDITFIAVGTSSKPDGSINLQYVVDSAKEIGKALSEKEGYHVVAVKSTVIPGTTEKVVKPTIERFSGKQCGKDFGLCVNPEFMREGSAIHDVLNPDRIIIGEHDKKSGITLETFYRRFHGKNLPPIIRTNIPTAEL